MYSVHRRLRQRKAHQLATMVLLLRDTTVKAAAQRGARHMVWLLKGEVHTVAAIGALQRSRTVGEAATDADAASRPELQSVRVALQLRRSDKVASSRAVSVEGDPTIGGRCPHNRLSELSDPHATISEPNTPHYSEVLWVPKQNFVAHFDSYSPCEHAKIALGILREFIAHWAGRKRATATTAPEVIVITKDEKSGIERQPSESNLCAFSSAFFLDTAIKLIFDLLDKGEDGDGDGGDDELELSLELKSHLQGLSVEATGGTLTKV